MNFNDIAEMATISEDVIETIRGLDFDKIDSYACAHMSISTNPLMCHVLLVIVEEDDTEHRFIFPNVPKSMAVLFDNVINYAFKDVVDEQESETFTIPGKQLFPG